MQSFEGLCKLGETISGTGADGTTLINHDKLGTIVTFPSYNPTGTQRGNKSRPARANQITAVLLRNVSGQTLLGKRLASVKLTAGYDPITGVDGYTIVSANKASVLIDPWLDSNGVLSNDLFWAVIGGPAPVLLPLTGAQFAGGDIAVGNFLMSATVNATSGATTSGRISNVSIANATDAQGAFDQANAVLGRALSARTTANTTAGSDLLVQWFIKWGGH